MIVSRARAICLALVLGSLLSTSTIAEAQTYVEAVSRAVTVRTIDRIPNDTPVEAVSRAYSVAIAEGTPSGLAFMAQPTDTVAGSTIVPAVAVAVRDANGIQVSNASNAVTLTAQPAAGGNALPLGTANAVNGLATFPGIVLTKAGGYTLRATATGLISATSAPFAIAPGPPAKLAIITQPTTTAARTAITPAVAVAVQDAYDNGVAGGSVSVVLGANPGGGTLGGTATRTADADGIATFDNLTINKVGTGYTLVASMGANLTVESQPFNVTPAPPVKLVLRNQSADAEAGAVLKGKDNQALIAELRDADDNLTVTTGAAVTIFIVVNSGGGTLGGTVTVNAVNGVATFNDLWINKAASGYRLRATSTGLASATTDPFAITPAAPAKLGWQTQMQPVTADNLLTTAQVAVQDTYGNTVTSSTASVTVGIASGAPGAVLGGTKTRNAVQGIATFDDLYIRQAGSYKLRAASPGLASTDSNTSAVSAGPATQVAFTAQPTTTKAGAAITPAVVVAARDAYGNVATGFTGSVATGGRTRSAVAGIATFADLSFALAETGKRLTATSSGLTPATSDAFDIVAGDPAGLAFVAQPTDTFRGDAIAPPVAVQVRDVYGNPCMSATNTVTVALGVNPRGGQLGGILAKSGAGGTVSFDNLAIDTAGIGYTLMATSPGLTAAESVPFTINGKPVAAVTLDMTPFPAVGVGRPILLTAIPTEGVNPEYRFLAKITTAGSYTVIRGWGTGATFDAWQPAAGMYNIYVQAREVGSSAIVDSRHLYPNVNLPLSAVGLAGSRVSPIVAGTHVQFGASATGGASVEYAFDIRSQGATTASVARAYLLDGRTVTWQPKTDGIYIITVKAREQGTQEEFTASLTYLVYPKLAGVAVQMTSAPCGPVAVGTPITLVAGAVGGSSMLEYQHQWNHSTTFTPSPTWVSGPYGPGRGFTMTPDQTGYYTFRVAAREKSGAVEVISTDLKIEVRPAVSSYTIALTPAAEGAVGGPISISATDIVGGAMPQWKFWVRRGGTPNWVLLRDYDFAPSVDGWAPDVPGTYVVMVYCREFGSRANYDKSVSVTYTVK